VTPAGIAGASNVTVTTLGGTATIAGGFTGVPTVTPSWGTLVEPVPDPAVVTDATLREAITATGYAWRVRDSATQIEMVLIPPGTFDMGCWPGSQDACEHYEGPVHSVTLTRPFYMSRYEVTQAQWTATMGSNPSYYQSPSEQVPADQVPNRPVEQVSWDMIQAFLGATGMRLPTEAEWEYSYRAGTTTAFHSMPGYPNGTNDDTLLGSIAWFSGNWAGQTRPVGQKAGNGYGLHDMSGNVHEWVNDWWDGYPFGPLVNPSGPSSGTYRALRGGGFGSSSSQCQSFVRFWDIPSYSYVNLGFRVARDPVEVPTLTAVSPPGGSMVGGTLITLTGTNLLGTTSVTVGGATATDVQVVSSTTVTAVTPAGAAGASDVTVTTMDGTAMLADAFTYVTVSSWATLIEALPDPAVVTDAALRSAITATGYAWRVRDTATQIELVLIPPGTFDMGCSPSIQHECVFFEVPVHTVTLTNAFYMGRYEVTQAQWMARNKGYNPSWFQSASAEVPVSQVHNRPVEQVTWLTTYQYFLSDSGMRLPTEAEWEFAYRAGTTTAFHAMPDYPIGTNDDNQLGTIAWFGSNSAEQTRPVGQKAGNGFGLHDMSGNVAEWVDDWFDFGYYASSPSVNPPGPSDGYGRVVRGGSWAANSGGCRSSAREYRPPFYKPWFYIGFRVVRDP
jgi:formylglycine-generating enzyme required for sulfatase activity